MASETAAHKFKTPQEKKRLSLAKDRRNTYGENDKASRKAIPRRKQIGQMQLRRAVAQELQLSGPHGGRAIEEIASKVAAVQTKKKHKRFKKAPDEPLGEVLKRKQRILAIRAARPK